MDAARDAAFENAITLIECDTMLSTSPLTRGFTWMVQFNYPFPAWIQIVQNLKRQPLSPRADRSWEALSTNYEAHHSRAVGTPQYSMFYKILVPVVLQAWAATEEAYEKLGEPVTTPRVISYIRQVILQKSQAPNTIQLDSTPSIDMNAFSTAIPMAFDPNLYFQMSNQQSNTSSEPWINPGMVGMPPLNVDPNQIDWSSMDWNMGSIPPPNESNDLSGQSLPYQ